MKVYCNYLFPSLCRLILAFLLFSYMTKKQGQELKHLKNKKSFLYEIKTFFIIFKRLSLKKIKLTFLEGEILTLKSHPYQQ